MTIALAIIVAALLVAGYIGWLNGVFLRCPHCGKVGSWHFDNAERPVEVKDEDGVLVESRRKRICRSCHGAVVDIWSDDDGRRMQKARSEPDATRGTSASDNLTTPSGRSGES
jgi:hypothetical protein